MPRSKITAGQWMIAVAVSCLGGPRRRKYDRVERIAATCGPLAQKVGVRNGLSIRWPGGDGAMTHYVATRSE